MDFKVAGTREGITALQMDIKIPGVTSHIMSEALAQAKEGRLYILDKMLEAIARSANGDLSLRAADLLDEDSDGQDSRRHRTRRQDDSFDHRADGREDRRLR